MHIQADKQGRTARGTIRWPEQFRCGGRSDPTWARWTPDILRLDSLGFTE
jgi:hypothetical protein